MRTAFQGCLSRNIIAAHMLGMCVFFFLDKNLVFKSDDSFIISVAVYEISCYSRFLQSLGIVITLIFVNLMDAYWHFIVVYNCISLITNENKAIFI